MSVLYTNINDILFYMEDIKTRILTVISELRGSCIFYSISDFWFSYVTCAYTYCSPTLRVHLLKLGLIMILGYFMNYQSTHQSS